MIPLPHVLARALVVSASVALLAVGAPWSAAQPAGSAGQNAIEGLEVGSEAGKVIVKMKLKEPMANPPAGFSLTNPPRIAFDFPNTVNALGKSTQEVKEGDLRSIRIGQGANRTRVVFSLDKAARFDAAVDGQNVVITLQPSAAASAPTAVAESTHFAAAAPAPKAHSVRGINFKRGRGGEGQVVIDLSDPGAGIDLKQSGKTIIVELLQTELPVALERRFDVTDFGTPVDFMEVTSQGDRVRVVINAKGRWEQSAYQTDNRFIVEVKPMVERPDQLAKPKGFTGEKLSLNFQNVEVRAVLQVIADFTGLNIITSDTVSGNLTLRLKDVPWDQALDIILQAKGLDARKTGNVVWIAPRDEIATKEKLALEAQQQISELEPLRTESFQLNYQKAEAFQKILSDIDAAHTVQARDRGDRPAHQYPVHQRHPVQAGRDPRPHQADRRRPAPGADRVAYRGSHRHLQQEPGRAGWASSTWRDSKGGIPGVGGGDIKSLLTGSSRSAGVQTGQTRRLPGVLLPGFVQRESAGRSDQRPPAGAVRDQPVQRRPHALRQPRDLRPAGRRQGQDRVQPARDHRRQHRGDHRAGKRDSLSAGDQQRRNQHFLPQGDAEPEGQAADHARRQCDHEARGAQGQPRRGNRRRTFDRHQAGEHRGAGGKRRHGQHRRHLHPGRASEVTKVPLLGDVPLFGVLFKQENNRNDRRELLIFVTPKILRDTVSAR